MKTTASADRHIFPISSAELAFAGEHGERYWIVRVFAGVSGDGTNTVMAKVVDPIARVRSGAIGLLLVL
eukprot:SAG22_NODE_846_length_6870_cov_4.577315_2_plen_69_part_00